MVSKNDIGRPAPKTGRWVGPRPAEAEAQAALTERIKDKARDLGADLVGIVAVDHLEAVIPTEHKPRRLMPQARSLIAVAKAMTAGAAYASREMQRHSRYHSQRCMDDLDTAAIGLTRWIERQGYMAITVPTDFPMEMSQEKKGMWGDLSHRHIAEEAGLGEVGINDSLLTPEFGPRVYLNAVLTTAELVPDETIAATTDLNLCLGAKCSLCVKVCPAQAISVRTDENGRERGVIKKEECRKFAHANGLSKLLRHLKNMITAPNQAETLNLLYSPTTWTFYQGILDKSGVSASCFECWNICPVGKTRREDGFIW